MQKVVNVLAVASSVVSLAVVGTGGYLYLNKDAIIKDVTDKALESVLGGGLGGLGGGNGIAPTLPTGTNDLAPTAPQASGVEPQQASTALPVASPEF
jgi:hypothetical protein